MLSQKTLLQNEGYVCVSYLEFCHGYKPEKDHIEKSVSKVQEDLRNGKKIIFIDWEHERVLRYHSAYKFIGFRKILGEHFEKNNWAISVPTFGHNDFFPRQINNLEMLIYINTFNKNYDTSKIDHHQKTKDFLLLTGKPHSHRVYLLKELLYCDMLSNSVWSASAPGYEWHDLEKKLPIEYEHTEFQNKSVNGYHYLTRQIHHKMYNNTTCSIVMETSVENDSHYITEKTCKPIMAEHVFVVLSSAGYLRNLRNLGFKTFHDHIDESYDDCEHLSDRVESLISTLTQIKNMDPVKLYNDTKDIRKHNRELFFNEKFYTEFNLKQMSRLKKYFHQ